MKQRVFHLNHNQCLQLKRGDQVRIQFKDYIFILVGEKKPKGDKK